MISSQKEIGMEIKILLVDDAVDFVNYVKKRLVLRGMVVSAAYNGKEALDLIQKQPFDIVVLDMLMPGIDGIETLKKIKKIKPKIEVILLTGHGTVRAASEAMKAGAVDFLQKPCDINMLIDSINNACETK